MSEQTFPLGGEVKAQCTSSTAEGVDAAVESCRLEQEAMCGYELEVKLVNQTHYTVPTSDSMGVADVYESFVTFKPR